MYTAEYSVSLKSDEDTTNDYARSKQNDHLICEKNRWLEKNAQHAHLLGAIQLDIESSKRTKIPQANWHKGRRSKYQFADVFILNLSIFKF